MPGLKKGGRPPAGWRPSVGGAADGCNSLPGASTSQQVATCEGVATSTANCDAERAVQHRSRSHAAVFFDGLDNGSEAKLVARQSAQWHQGGGRSVHDRSSPVVLLDGRDTRGTIKAATCMEGQESIGNMAHVGYGRFDPAKVTATEEVHASHDELHGQVTLASLLDGLDGDSGATSALSMAKLESAGRAGHCQQDSEELFGQPGKNSKTVSWAPDAESARTKSTAPPWTSRATLAGDNLKASVRKAHKIVLDMDSFVVDTLLKWQKEHALANFSLIGRIFDSLQEWSKSVQARGTLSVDDFGVNGVELDLSGTPALDEATGDSRGRYEQLASALRRDYSITCFRISGARIGNAGCGWIAGAVMRNRTLRQLVLSDNLISDEGLGGLVAVLDKNQTLSELDLGGNFVTSEGATLLADGLRHNCGLKDLNLNLNAIGEQGANALADALEHANSTARLRSLNLEGNLLGAHACARLAALLNTRTSHLEVLFLPEEEEGQHQANIEALVPGIKPDAGHEPAHGETFLVVCSEAGVDIGTLGVRRQQPSWLQDARTVQITLRDSRLSRANKGVIKVDFSIQRLRVYFEQSPILDVELCGLVKVTDSKWVLGHGVIRLTLEKADSMHWPGLTASE